MTVLPWVTPSRPGQPGIGVGMERDRLNGSLLFRCQVCQKAYESAWTFECPLTVRWPVLTSAVTGKSILQLSPWVKGIYPAYNGQQTTRLYTHEGILEVN